MRIETALVAGLVVFSVASRGVKAACANQSAGAIPRAQSSRRVEPPRTLSPARHANYRAPDWSYGLPRIGGLHAYWPGSYPGYGWPYVDYGYSFFPYSYGHSPYYPYLYFYDLYAREAEESKRAADEFEASLAREGKLTGPAKPGTYPSDSKARLPSDGMLTLDGQPHAPAPGGEPLVVGSGRHTLRISARVRASDTRRE